MQTIILSLHSIFRWLILLFALLVIINSVSGMGGSKAFTAGNRRNALFLMICCDIQLLIGLFLYFTDGWFTVLKSGAAAMKDATSRFFSLEHTVMMLLAIILIHVGYSNTKKNIADKEKFKRLFWFTFIAVIIVLAAIPWPGREAIGRPLLRLPS